MSHRVRCAWSTADPLLTEYHDREWGVPERDSDHLFGKLVLDGAQAGLSWLTILRKREGYLDAFDGFNARKMAGYDETKIAQLLKNPAIIRNRQKIQSAVRNARAYVAMQEKGIDFSEFLWSFTDGRTLQNQWRSEDELPAATPESEAMSRGLRQHGFSFVGPTICYAFMQAVGIVNDHVVDCFRHAPLARQ